MCYPLFQLCLAANAELHSRIGFAATLRYFVCADCAVRCGVIDGFAFQAGAAHLRRQRVLAQFLFVLLGTLKDIGHRDASCRAAPREASAPSGGSERK